MRGTVPLLVFSHFLQLFQSHIVSRSSTSPVSILSKRNEYTVEQNSVLLVEKEKKKIIGKDFYEEFGKFFLFCFKC